MNTYYLKKFRDLADTYVYARISDQDMMAEIVCDYMHGIHLLSPLYYTYGCSHNDIYLDGKGHFADYKIWSIDTYNLDNDKEVALLRKRLREARRVYILKLVASMRYRKEKKEKEAYLKRINANVRVEI